MFSSVYNVGIHYNRNDTAFTWVVLKVMMFNLNRGEFSIYLQKNPQKTKNPTKQQTQTNPKPKLENA